MKTKSKKNDQPVKDQSETAPKPSSTIPTPMELMEMAKTETRIIAARDYIATINILRDQKSYSFREIAAWFNERGVPLDNNEIYRAYMADMDTDEKQMLKQAKKDIDPED